MRKLEPIHLKPWTLPVIIIALAVPIVAAFSLAGPGAGLAVGALVAAAVIVGAARASFDEPIEVASPPRGRYMLLVVAISSLEGPGLAGAIAEIASAGAKATGAGGEQAVLVLAPAISARVAHWMSDLRQARFDAQRRLAVSLASLATAGVGARGEVGDSDPVQAVEDTLRTFPAQEVVFVTASDHLGEVEEVRRRLDRRVRVLESG